MLNNGHYFSEKYNDKFRWLSYWHQINEVLRLKPKNVLEVGSGNKTVYDYLKRRGIAVFCADINSKLKPDFLASATNLKGIENCQFDVVLCCQVLEHLPFEKFEASLKELKRVCQRFIVLSLPHCGPYFKFNFHLPLLGERTIFLKISGVNKSKFSDGHYWEIGERGYPLRKIKKCFKKVGLKINKTFLLPERPFHRFFILEKQ